MSGVIFMDKHGVEYMFDDEEDAAAASKERELICTIPGHPHRSAKDAHTT